MVLLLFAFSLLLLVYAARGESILENFFEFTRTPLSYLDRGTAERLIVRSVYGVYCVDCFHSRISLRHQGYDFELLLCATGR